MAFFPPSLRRRTVNVTFNTARLPLPIIGVSLQSIGVPLRPAWFSFGHDGQSSAWPSDVSKLSTATAKDLTLKWSVQLDNIPLALNALTAPLVATDVPTLSGVKTLAYVGGSSNRLFALDAANGAIVWERTFQSFVAARSEPFFL